MILRRTNLRVVLRRTNLRVVLRRTNLRVVLRRTNLRVVLRRTNLRVVLTKTNLRVVFKKTRFGVVLKETLPGCGLKGRVPPFWHITVFTLFYNSNPITMVPCAPFSDIQALKDEFLNLYFSAIANDLHLYFCFGHIANTFNPRPTGGAISSPPLVFLRYLLNRCRYHRQTCSTLSPNIFTHCVKILKSRVS